VSTGFNQGKDAGFNEGIESGYIKGKDTGYQTGFKEGESTTRPKVRPGSVIEHAGQEAFMVVHHHHQFDAALA
jgi:flagellar biosynthesis/type III secretory pathway protein FliH